MGYKNELQKKIDKKTTEINELENKLLEAKAYLQGLYDSLKLLPKENVSPADDLRQGSDMAKARKAILKMGKPLHIVEILKEIGKDANKSNKLSLAGSLSACVRKGRVFTKSAPNTFGLIEMGENKNATEPPDDFGVQ